MSATTDVAATETAVATAKACVSSGATGMSAAAAVTSAMLRPQGYGQKQGERRNGHQPPHIGLLYAWYARKS